MRDLPGLVFDLDGTLIDSAPEIHAAANKVFSARGIPGFPFEIVRGFIGNGVGVLVSRLMAHQGHPPDADTHSELVADFIKIYEEAFDLTTVYPGALDALKVLSGLGHPMAICTNKPEAPARAVLSHFGLAQHFQVVIGGDSMAQRKPDPRPLLAARHQLGVDKVLFIGDSEVDAETASAAEIPFVLFTQGYRKTPVEALGAKVIFDDYCALPGLVDHVTLRL